MARASGGGFRRWVLLLAGVSLLALGAASVALRDASAAGRSPEDPAERLVLRLHDLPPGYFPLDLSEGNGIEFICEPLEPADPKPKLAGFIDRFSPEGCMGLYLRAYRVPDVTPSAAVVGTGALDAGSDAAATAGFAVGPELLGKLTENGVPEEVGTEARIGDATRLFHWKRAPAYYRNGHLGSFLVWRSGNVLAAVFASAGSLEASDRIVEDLARRQQAHIEYPTPYTRGERNSSEVGLDDPQLRFPVQWLGRTFRPGHGLPPARLESGGAMPRPYALPRQKLSLSNTKNVYLNLWTSTGWKRFLTTAPGRSLRTWHCTESTELDLPNGRATVFSGYRRDFDVCPERPPDRYFAFAYIGGTVTAVNFVSCRQCWQLVSGPYNSLPGMKAVVRGLRLRPKPVYQAR